MEQFNEKSKGQAGSDSGSLDRGHDRFTEVKPGVDPRELKARPLLRDEPKAADPVLGFVVREDEMGWISGLLEELTPRQRDVLTECCSGGSSEEIASRMGISGSTLQNHLHAMGIRLGVTGRDSLARLVGVRLIRGYRTRSGIRSS